MFQEDLEKCLTMEDRDNEEDKKMILKEKEESQSYLLNVNEVGIISAFYQNQFDFCDYLCQSLYSCSGGMSLLENDLLTLRQDLQTTAQRQMSRGGTQSIHTLGRCTVHCTLYTVQ